MRQIFKSKNKFVSWFKSNSSTKKNVYKLLTGMASAQFLTIAFSPIITRLYTPRDYGYFAAFTSLLTLLKVIKTFGYESSILVPKEDDEAFHILVISFLILLIISFFTLFLICSNIFSDFFTTDSTKIIWLLPFGVFLSGSFDLLSYWIKRVKLFGSLAIITFKRSVFGVIINISFSGINEYGLFLGSIGSEGLASIDLIKKIFIDLKKYFSQINIKSSKMVLIKYRDFAFFGLPAGLVSTFGLEIPNLIFISQFGPESLGQLSISQRFLVLPTYLIGKSMGDVLRSDAAEIYRKGNLDTLLIKLTRKLVLAAILFSILIGAIFAPLVPLIFGSSWRGASIIMVYLIPFFIGQFIVTPISGFFESSLKLKESFYAQLLLTGTKMLGLIILVNADFRFENSILIFSLFSLLGYVFYYLMVFKAVRN